MNNRGFGHPGLVIEIAIVALVIAGSAALASFLGLHGWAAFAPFASVVAVWALALTVLSIRNRYRAGTEKVLLSGKRTTSEIHAEREKSSNRKPNA